MILHTSEVGSQRSWLSCIAIAELSCTALLYNPCLGSVQLVKSKIWFSMHVRTNMLHFNFCIWIFVQHTTLAFNCFADPSLFFITSCSSPPPLHLSDCNRYLVHAVNNIDYIWWTAGCRTQEAFQEPSEVPWLASYHLGCIISSFSPFPSPVIFWWLLLDGFLSGGKSTDAKWMTADVFP